MKLIALHRSNGKIVAAVRISDEYQGPVPVAGKGTRVTEIAIPSAFERLDLATLCARFRVNVRARKLVESKPKREAKSS